MKFWEDVPSFYKSTVLDPKLPRPWWLPNLFRVVSWRITDVSYVKNWLRIWNSFSRTEIMWKKVRKSNIFLQLCRIPLLWISFCKNCLRVMHCNFSTTMLSTYIFFTRWIQEDKNWGYYSRKKGDIPGLTFILKVLCLIKLSSTNILPFFYFKLSWDFLSEIFKLNSCEASYIT